MKLDCPSKWIDNPKCLLGWKPNPTIHSRFKQKVYLDTL